MLLPTRNRYFLNSAVRDVLPPQIRTTSFRIRCSKQPNTMSQGSNTSSSNWYYRSSNNRPMEVRLCGHGDECDVLTSNTDENSGRRFIRCPRWKKKYTASKILSVAGSNAATAVVVRAIANDLLPPELHDNIFSGICRLLSAFSNQLTTVIDEFDGLDPNDIYQKYGKEGLSEEGTFTDFGTREEVIGRDTRHGNGGHN